VTTATSAAPGPAPRGVVNPYATGTSLAHQVLLLARRSIRGAFSSPAGYMPGIVMPLMLITINSSALQRATEIPGFPTDRFLDFILVLAFMQGALFATSTAGLGLVRDIESGFLDRLALTPMRAGALVIAQISGAIMIAMASALLYVAIGLVFDVNFRSGWAGILVLLAIASWTAFAFATIGAWIALRSGQSEALQGVFPLLFATLFLSTINMPRELIQAGWFEAITRVNPVSYMVDGMRSLIVTGWDARVLAEAALVLVIVSAVGVFGCSRALRRRMAKA
jgi:ABC-2 type transport system permease protein